MGARAANYWTGGVGLQLQNIRLSSNEANPLSRSWN